MHTQAVIEGDKRKMKLNDLWQGGFEVQERDLNQEARNISVPHAKAHFSEDSG